MRFFHSTLPCRWIASLYPPRPSRTQLTSSYSACTTPLYPASARFSIAPNKIYCLYATHFLSIQPCLSSIEIPQSINRDVLSIDEFVDKGTEALSARPQSVEEIGAVNAIHAQLSLDKVGACGLFDAVEQKNKLLRYVDGTSLSSLYPQVGRGCQR